MGTMKYFSGDREVQHIFPMDNGLFRKLFPDTKGRRWDGFSMFAANDGPELLPVTRCIHFKSNPSLHKCGAKCVNAKGGDCECSCGGANHGKGG